MRVRSLRRAVTTGAMLVLLAGCGLLGADPDETSPAEPDPRTRTETAPADGTLAEPGTTSVELAAGETVQVPLGEGSIGIGDDWGVVPPTEAAVVDAEVVTGQRVIGAPEPEDPPQDGGSTSFAVELTGVAEGEATVRVLYCTRSPIEEDCDQSQGTLDAPVEPVEIAVTVG